MLTDEELQQLIIKADPSKEYAFSRPQEANYKLSLDSDSSAWVQFYIKRPPNRLQRWLTWKVFGIKGEIL